MPTNHTLQAVLLDAARGQEAELSASLAEYMALPKHRFSRGYRARRKELRNRVAGKAPLTGTRLRLRMLVPLVAVLVMLAAALSVQAVRAPIIAFAKRVYQEMTDYYLRIDPDSVAADAVAPTDFVLEYIPEGYTLADTQQNPVLLMRVYRDASGGMFIVSLHTNESEMSISLDTENAQMTETEIQGLKTIIASKDTGRNLLMVDASSRFACNIVGTLSMEDVVKIAENCRLK